MDGSYLWSPEEKAVAEEIARLSALLSNPYRSRDATGRSINRLIDLSVGLQHYHRLELLVGLAGAISSGGVSQSWGEVLDFRIAAVIVSVSETDHHPVSRHILATAHERYALLGLHLSRLSYHEYRQHRARAYELRHPKEHAVKQATKALLKQAAIAYIRSKQSHTVHPSRQRGISR